MGKELLKDLKFWFKCVAVALYVLVMAVYVIQESSVIHIHLFMIAMHGSAVVLVTSIVLAVVNGAQDKFTEILFMMICGGLSLSSGLVNFVEFSYYNVDFELVLLCGGAIIMGILMLLVPVLHAKQLGEIPDLFKQIPFTLLFIALILQTIVAALIFNRGLVTPNCHNMLAHWVFASAGTCTVIIATFVTRYIFEGSAKRMLEMPFLIVAAVLAGLAAALFLMWGLASTPKSGPCTGIDSAGTDALKKIGDAVKGEMDKFGDGIRKSTEEKAAGAAHGGDEKITWMLGFGEVIVCVLTCVAIFVKFFSGGGGGGGGGSESYE